jgi:hypothetical protein
MKHILRQQSGFLALPLLGVVGGLVIVMAAFTLGIRLGRRPDSSITTNIIVQQMNQVAQLVSTKAYVQDIIEYDNTRRILGVLKSQKRVLVVVRGHVNLGIDLDSLAPTFDNVAKTASVTVPHARLLDAVQDAPPHYYDVHTSLFNRFTTRDAELIQGAADSALRAVATQGGVLQQADSGLKRTLMVLLGRYGYALHVTFQ